MADAATADSRQMRMLVMHERTLSRAAAELATCQVEMAEQREMLEAAGASESDLAAGILDSLFAQVEALEAREDALLQRRGCIRIVPERLAQEAPHLLPRHARPRAEPRAVSGGA